MTRIKKTKPYKRTHDAMMSPAEFAAWVEALPAIRARVDAGESDAAAFRAEITDRGFNDAAEFFTKGRVPRFAYQAAA